MAGSKTRSFVEAMLGGKDVSAELRTTLKAWKWLGPDSRTIESPLVKVNVQGMLAAARSGPEWYPVAGDPQSLSVILAALVMQE